METPDIADDENEKHILPADPDVKNFSYTVVDGEVFYRENSVMTQVELSDTAKGRVTGIIFRKMDNDLSLLVQLKSASHKKDNDVL